MEFVGKLELFSHTVENRFVFSLFDLLLCGVILLVVLRGWRRHAAPLSARNRLFLFSAFTCLGTSFALEAIFTAALLFFQRHLPVAPFDLLIHTLQASAWLLLAASAYHRSAGSGPKPGASQSRLSVPLLLSALLGQHLTTLVPRLDLRSAAVLDLMNLFFLAFAFLLFYRRPLGGQNLATGALAFLFMAAFLHLASSLASDTSNSIVLWNLEQFAWLLSLFTFALAIGEASQDLFDRVFVRLQIAFILLASLMILVITQTEKAEYLASIRSRSDNLAEFVRAHVDHFRQRNDSLPRIIEREDFLQRLTLGFGDLPELKLVRIFADSQVATFEIADNGAIQRTLGTHLPTRFLSLLDPDEYFLIQSLPLTVAKPGVVEFYGTRAFLNGHIRKRIILIFSLFTGMVVLSTLMIGWVVRGASVTIRQQAREIEEGQRRLMQASKFAAIGELAAGVAHEINNPATTILSRGSFLLSKEGLSGSPSDREDLRAIVDQAHRIAQVTRGLLMFSRPVAVTLKAVPIDRIIEASLRSVEDLLTAHHISVEKSIGPNLPGVLADEDNLARALENIHRNAIDAMPAGGTLRVRAAKDNSSGTRLRVEISDTGVGIEAENLARIWDPFFTTKEVGKGTGLGLSIVHGIVKEHHGTIAVESQPGAGTTFTILLPTEQ